MIFGEDFGYLKDKKQSNTLFIVKRSLKISAILTSIAIFAYISITAYNFVNFGPKKKEIPLITSPDHPIKTYPEKQQDKKANLDQEIYDSLVSNQGKNQKPVKIKNAPEIPQIKKAIENQKDKILANKHINLQNDQQQLMSKFNNQALVKNVIKGNQKPVNKVQIAALKSSDDAVNYWQNIKSKYPKLVKNHQYFIERIDLGAKGIFFRLHVGLFDNKLQAQNFCKEYVIISSKTKADCLVL